MHVNGYININHHVCVELSFHTQPCEVSLIILFLLGLGEEA